VECTTSRSRSGQCTMHTRRPMWACALCAWRHGVHIYWPGNTTGYIHLDSSAALNIACSYAQTGSKNWEMCSQNGETVQLIVNRESQTVNLQFHGQSQSELSINQSINQFIWIRRTHRTIKNSTEKHRNKACKKDRQTDRQRKCNWQSTIITITNELIQR